MDADRGFLEQMGPALRDPMIFQVLRETTPGLGGEIQLSDALRTLARADPPTGGTLILGSECSAQP